MGVHNTEYVVGDTASSVASDRKYNETPNSLDYVDPELDERISDEILNDDDMRRLQVSHVVGPKAYYIGIVDFQQEFDFPKKVGSLLDLWITFVADGAFFQSQYFREICRWNFLYGTSDVQGEV